MIKTMWRSALNKRTFGALLEAGRPLVAHAGIDQLRLRTAPEGVPAGTSLHGIQFPGETSNLIEVPRWTEHDVLDQLGANSCVANAIMRAERSTLIGRHGLDPRSVPLGSRLHVYFFARYVLGMHALDDGCYPSVAIQQMAARGVPPEEAWPYSMAAVNRQPGVKSRWDGAERRGVRGTYLVYEQGPARLERIRSAHASGRSVTLTLPVYTDMMRGFSPLLRWPLRGSTLYGYHHVELGGTVHSAGQWWGLCANSWGQGFGAGGFFAVDETYLLEQASSVCVVDPEEPVR